MSLIGAFALMIGSAISTSVEKAETKKKIKTLESSRNQLDKEFQKNYEAISADKTLSNKVTTDLKKEKKSQDEVFDTKTWHDSNNHSTKVSKSSTINSDYNSSLKKGLKDVQKKKESQLDKITSQYQKDRESINKEILSTEGDKGKDNFSFDIINDTINNTLNM